MVEAKKSLGQHWLNDDASLAAMLEMAEVNSSDTVLEIGPGHGSLTAKLLASANKVIAVEKDEVLAIRLANKFLDENLEVITCDILRYDLANLPVGYKLVANIPYYLTSHLVKIISESSNPPSIAALLVQKEVAERLAAGPGQMSILAVTAQFYWEISLARVVEAELFEPPPKVDSQIVRLVRRQEILEVDPKQFFHLVKAGFSSKRKTLANNLAAGFHLEKPPIADLIERANLDSRARPQTLSLTDWKNLFDQLPKS